jgi:hypothetical protein
MTLHLHKRDRYARRPDKAWRSKMLREFIRGQRFDMQDTFWYNNSTETKETKDNDNLQRDSPNSG